MGQAGTELEPAASFAKLIRPDDPPVALEAGLQFLKTPQELGISTGGDRLAFTAVFSADAVTARFLPTGLGDVKTLFTTGIEGGPALRHVHGTAFDTERGTLWVTDTELDNDIFEFDVISSGDRSSIKPLTRLDVPVSGMIEGIGFDPEDNTLYYVDASGRVRHIERDGTLLGSFQSDGSLGLAVQGDYVWVDNGEEVFKHNKLTGQFTGVSFFVKDMGLAFDFDRDLIWTGHWNDGRFEAYDLDTGEQVFQSKALELPEGNGRGHNLGYGDGRIWVATETLEGDLIYGIEVIAEPVEASTSFSALDASEAPAPPVTPSAPGASGQ